jgi:hypothetical protein
MWRGKASRFAAVALLATCLPSCGAGKPAAPSLQLKTGEMGVPVPTHDPLRQSVEVAYLEPRTELGVDVISGRVYAADSETTNRGGLPGEHEALIGLVDPQFHNRIFAYRGGIPEEPAWNPRWGNAPAPAPGKLPAWTSPRLVTRGGKAVAVALADGRRVWFETDHRGRIVRVRWATARGEPLITKIGYARGTTRISAPAGIVRSYRFDMHDRVTEVDAPGAAATARRDTADGYLDSNATAKMLAYRLRSGTPERYAAYEAAPKAISENSFALPAVGGHETYGVKSLHWMRVVDAALRRAGVLDVTEAIPVFNDYVEDYSQEKTFDAVWEDLRVSCQFGVGWYAFTYGLDTPAGEIATIASRLAHGPDRWIRIYYRNARRLGCGVAVE